MAYALTTECTPLRKGSIAYTTVGALGWMVILSAKAASIRMGRLQSLFHWVMQHQPVRQARRSQTRCDLPIVPKSWH